MISCLMTNSEIEHHDNTEYMCKNIYIYNVYNYYMYMYHINVT